MSEFIDNLAKTSDEAIDNHDAIKINEIILNNLKIIEDLPMSQDKTYGYYILGNLWSELRKIKHKQNETKIWNLEQEEVFKEIYYFRKAIQQKDFKNLDLSLRLAIYVNLGNAFNHYGRTINAIKYFDKAIVLNFSHKNIANHPNHFMALVNKGLALEYYSKLDYDGGHRAFFIKFAYKNFKDAVSIIDNYLENDNLDKEYYQKIKENIISKLKWYEEYFSSDDLEDIDYFKNYKTNFSKDENEYRKWCVSNKLFLNSINDLESYDIATHDLLNLPNLTTKLDEGFPKVITNFNQLKQEFITYRHLLFEGLHGKTPKYYDKETYITDDYDYNLYDINIEKIKMAFRGFYSIFDKIANFIYEYFIKVETEKKIDFRNIWLDKNGKINDVFNETENLALRGLYLISKDLFFNKNNNDSTKFIEVLEPEAQKINDIRNHLEHKFISIKLLDIEWFETYKERDRNFAIPEDELQQKTIHLAQLVREAMIYLSFAIHIEEKKKKDANPDGYLDIPLEVIEKL